MILSAVVPSSSDSSSSIAMGIFIPLGGFAAVAESAGAGFPRKSGGRLAEWRDTAAG